MEKLIKVRIPFAGFYESNHHDLFDTEIEQTFPEESGASEKDAEYWTNIFNDNIDWRSLREEYAKEYVSQIQFEVTHYLKPEHPCKNIKFENITLWSPEYYNFETDEIFAEISATDLRLIFDATDKELFAEQVRGHFTSRSGFISFYDPDWTTWDEDYTTWNAPQYLPLIEAFLMTMGLIELEEDIFSRKAPKHPHEKLESYLHFDMVEDFSGCGTIQTILWNHLDEDVRNVFNELGASGRMPANV